MLSAAESQMLEYLFAVTGTHIVKWFIHDLV